MPSPNTTRRPVRIGGASGGFTDRVAAIARLASDTEVDAIVGDWLSENVMTGYGVGKAPRDSLGASGRDVPLNERRKTGQFASTFLQCFEPAMHKLAENGAKLAVNAGASDTELLAEICRDIVDTAGLDLKVAWVEGDDVTIPFERMVEGGATFRSVDRNSKCFRRGSYSRSCGVVARLGCHSARQTRWWVTSQLVYEISGPLYFNSDVVADLHNISLEETGQDRVHVSGVRGLAPPAHNAVRNHGDWRVPSRVALLPRRAGHEEKCQWMEEQARYAIGEELISKFSMLMFHVHGTSPANPRNQEMATVDFRIFAQAGDAALFDPDLPDGFARKLYETVLQSCPVSTSEALGAVTCII